MNGFNCKLSKRTYNQDLQEERWLEADLSGKVVGDKVLITWTINGEETKYVLTLTHNGLPLFNKPSKRS